MLPLMLQTFLSLDTHTHVYIHVLLIKTKRILPLINKKRIQFVKRRLVPSSRTFTRKRSAAGNNGNLWPPASFNPRRFSNYPEPYRRLIHSDSISRCFDPSAIWRPVGPIIFHPWKIFFQFPPSSNIGYREIYLIPSFHRSFLSCRDIQEQQSGPKISYDQEGGDRGSGGRRKT